MRHKPAKSPTSTQTAALPPVSRIPASFPLSNSVFRAYFLAVTPQPDDPFDRSVLSPHYLPDEDLRPAVPIPVAISVPRTIPEPLSDTGTKKREVVFTSQGETKAGELLRKKLVKPRTAMSQSRLGETKGDRAGLTMWMQKYFRFPEKEKKPVRRKIPAFHPLPNHSNEAFRLCNSFTTTSKSAISRSKGASTAFKRPTSKAIVPQSRSRLAWTTAVPKSHQSFTHLSDT